MFVSDGLQQGELFKAHFVPFIDRIAPPDNNAMVIFAIIRAFIR
jgi:hypothetical protein